MAMQYGPRLPLPYGWDLGVHDAGASHYLYCKSDFNAEPSFTASLRNIYVHQFGHSDSVTPGPVDSNLFDVFVEGDVNDPQLTYEWRDRTNTADMQWVYDLNGGNPPEENQAMVAIATCAAFLVTLTPEYMEFKPLGHHPQWSSGSDHWICEGDPQDEDGWVEDQLVRLTGRNYATVNPPVYTDAVEDTDYGMNSFIESDKHGMGQILLVEYSAGTVWLNGTQLDEPFDGDLENGEIMDRHLGVANVLLVDGSIVMMTKEELQAEYEKIGSEPNMWEMP